VRDLITRFEQMREMMAALGSRGGLLSRMTGLGNLAGAGGINPGLLAGGPGALAGAAGMGTAISRRDLARQRSGKRDKRKQARKARKKNRKR
jgi:hypothetical protein